MKFARFGPRHNQPSCLLLMLVCLLLGSHKPAAAQPSETSAAANATIPTDVLKKNWPSFRGFRSQGYAADASPPLAWDAESGKNILWKVPIAKHGMSSPVVWKDRVFLTGANDESRDIYCLNAENGMPLWTHSVSDLAGAPENGELPRVLDSTGYAAPTMTTNGRLLAAVFATGELVCLNMQGERVWAKHLGIPDNHYGHSSSLICNEELLFVQYDQKENAKLYAFKMANGEPVWQADRDQMSWSSPILIDNNGRSELVLTDSKSVAGYDPATGERYWRVECLDAEVASSAAFASGYIFVANEGAAASAIDISNREEDPSIVWQWDESLPDAASPLASKDFVLLPTAFGVVTCLASETGDVLWEQEFDRGFTSSPVAIGNRVYLTDLAGNTQIFRLSDRFELLGESSIGESVYATPAIVGSRIYIRGLYHLVCVSEVR